jgi:hypothetical protein
VQNEDDEPITDILTDDQFRTLQRDNPKALLRLLEDTRRSFVFGIEDRRDDESGAWGGALRVVINRNLTLHLVTGFNDDMSSREELPQFCLFPNPDRADQTEETSIAVDDFTVKGLIFYVDPFDLDVYLREAALIAEAYPTWDAIPDTYYLDHELVQFVTRTVLDEPLIAAERKFDFRRGIVGGVAPPPIDETEYTAQELIESESTDEDEDASDDDAPPLTGMRTQPVEFG